MRLRFPILPAALFLLSSTTLAQTITPVVQEGDMVTGVGAISLISNMAVNSSGLWIVEADTNAATAADGVVLRGGALFVREGDPMSPPPATLSSVDGFGINAAGDVGWNVFLDGLTSSTDTGVFFNTTLVIQEGNFSTAPQFSMNTPYTGWSEARMNDNNQILMLSSLDDPAIASTTDRAIVIATVDGLGNLMSEAVIVKEGDSLPGIAVETLADVATGPHNIAFNNAGLTIFQADMTGATATDGALVIGDTSTLSVVAREGDPSPIAGRNYETLTFKALDINDSGEWVHAANLDGATTDDEVIIKNGTTIIAQEGTSLPAIGGVFTFTSFGSGAVRIDNFGNVFWFGDWNDPDTTRDMGLFRNDQLIVQEGVTMIGGMLLENLVATTDNFSISPDGRYLIFEGFVTGSIDSALLMDFGPVGPAPQPFCFGDGSGTLCPCGNSGAPGNGCANSVNPAGANLAAAGASSLSADTLVLTSSGRPGNAPGLFFQGTTQINGGLGATFGDGLRCAGGTVVRLKIVIASPAGLASYPGGGDPSVSVRGMVAAPGDRHYQDWYRNAPVFCTPDTFNLTNGLTVTWAP